MYISGQIGLSPSTGKLVEGGVELECKQVLANIHAILQAAGADYKNGTFYKQMYKSTSLVLFYKTFLFSLFL